MNSTHCLLLLTNAFLWILLPVLYGHPQQLPEVIEDTNENSSTCYGTLTQFQPSCSHRPGTVIGVQSVKVGAKRTSLACPDNVPDVEPRNDTCCMPNTTTDCIQVFDYMKSFIPEKYKFHNLCSGYPQCITAAETVWAQTDCDNSTAEYMKNTNYMFMEFSCIEETKIGDMCSDNKYTGSTVYLQTPEYPNNNISANINNCTCHVTSLSDVMMYTLDVRLYGQTLTVADKNGSKIYEESSSTMFNITSHVLKGGDVWMTLDTSSLGKGAYVWVGFEAMNLSSLTITCKVYGLEETTTAYSSSPTTPNNSTTPLNSATSSNQDTEPQGQQVIPIIIGAVVGVLLLLLLVLLVCYLVKRKKRNLDRKRKISTLMQDDKESEISRKSRQSFNQARTPMNEKFKSSTINSNRVEPTRYIEEHGGNMKSNSVLPSLSRSTRRLSPDLGNGYMYQPTLLPPISNGHSDVFKSVNESTTDETQHRKKKKSKKRKSNKDKHRDGSQSEDVRESRLHGSGADLHDDKRHTDKDERRHSEKNRSRNSDSSVHERRHSDNDERRYSDNNERRYSGNDERNHSDKNERRHSKERKHRKHSRHSSKKSSSDN